jgi:zinc protease
MRGLKYLAAIVMTVGGAFSAAAAPAGVEVQSFTLKNGMQVVVLPDHRAPIVTHMVWYKIGGADDPRGQSGIAHFLEHLMFKRTKNLAEGEFSRIVANNGGQHNAFTNYDYTGYYQKVAVDRLELMMRLESDRMANLDLNPKDIAAERDVIIQERRMRLDNSPAALLNEQMNAVQFMAHPYGTPLIGWLDEMRKLSYQDALSFYQKYYNPLNAVLVVAGDVTPDQIKLLAEKYYGVIPSHPLPERVRRAEPAPIAARRVELDDVRVQQPAFERSYIAPSYHRGETKLAVPLDVLAEILGGGSTSRLYKRLVLEKNLAVTAGASYSGSAYDLGSFSISATPEVGKDPSKTAAVTAEVEEAVDGVIRDILDHGVQPDELERARNKLIATAIYARDNSSTMAEIFGEALTTGQTVEDVLAWPDRVAAVTAEDVMAAARFIFTPENSVTGLLMPKAAAAPAKAGPMGETH